MRRLAKKPPPPAQAGRVIAREPGTSAPLDLTGNTFVTGTADVYAGGVTSSTGTNKEPVESRVVDPTSPPGPGAVDLSRPVGLADVDWSDCGWPPTAQASDLDWAVAVIRVEVRADGTAAGARVVADPNPGLGFGDLAVSCALRKHYPPALNAAGHAIPSSPLVKVRFTR
jgi:hypothetical protein